MFVLVSATCARLSCILSFRVQVKLFYCIHVNLFYRIVSYRCYTKPSNCNNLRIVLAYSRHIYSRVFWLRQTYCQHSLHPQTLLLVGSHASPPPFGAVFLCLYALLTVSLLVLGLSSLCSQDVCSQSAVRASDTRTRSFARYKFVTYLLSSDDDRALQSAAIAA